MRIMEANEKQTSLQTVKVKDPAKIDHCPKCHQRLLQVMYIIIPQPLTCGWRAKRLTGFSLGFHILWRGLQINAINRIKSVAFSAPYPPRYPMNAKGIHCAIIAA